MYNLLSLKLNSIGNQSPICGFIVELQLYQSLTCDFNMVDEKVEKNVMTKTS